MDRHLAHALNKISQMSEEEFEEAIKRDTEIKQLLREFQEFSKYMESKEGWDD